MKSLLFALCAISLYIVLFMPENTSKPKTGLQAYLMLKYIHKMDGSIGVSEADVVDKHRNIPRAYLLLERLQKAGYIEKHSYNRSEKPKDIFYLTTKEGDTWLSSGAILAFTWTAIKFLGVIAAAILAVIGCVKLFHK